MKNKKGIKKKSQKSKKLKPNIKMMMKKMKNQFYIINFMMSTIDKCR